MTGHDFRASLFSDTNQTFDARTLEVFRWQARHNEVYSTYLQYLGVQIELIDSLDKIPFLPISFFKTHRVITGKKKGKIIFRSSGTTNQKPSTHHISDLSLYHDSLLYSFRHFYGDPSDYAFLALLPGYLERNDSSLVYMANELMLKGDKRNGGFFLDRFEQLAKKLIANEGQGIKSILLGVSFALIDFSEQYPLKLKHTIVMETGGMKGIKEEMTRHQLHKMLKQNFGISEIHSEYGMTELLSQAYSKNSGIFLAPPWMKVSVRDLNDPLQNLPNGKMGAINIIDLANLYSCCFISTDDMGIVHPDGSFEVTGRMDQSEVRGCNLLFPSY